MLKTKYADPIKTMYYQIRKRIVVFLIMGIVFSFGIGLGLLGTILSNEELQIHIILFISFSFIFSITILCYSLAIMINPHLYRPVRTNPDIYKQLYLLAENTEYQDRLICLSGNIISPINMLYNITTTEKIVWVYLIKKKVYFADAGSELCICSVDTETHIELDGISKKELEQTIMIICYRCPNAAIGYTQDNIKRYNYILKNNKP